MEKVYMAMYVISGLTAGAFIYQGFSENPDYTEALDRAYFSAIGVIAFLIAVTVFNG